MAYAKVEETFWHDSVVRSLSEQGRILYLYLLTCPHRNRIGCFVLDPWYASADLQWDQEDVRDALDELIDAERIGWDSESRVVFLIRFLDYNTLENQKVVKAATGDLKALPDNPFLSELLDALERNHRPHYSLLTEALSNRIENCTANGNGNGMPYRGRTRAFLRSRSQSRSRNQNRSQIDRPESKNPDSGRTRDESESELPVDQSNGLRELVELHPWTAEVLAGLEHPGGHESTVITLQVRFLYPDEENGMADPSVRGLDLDQRKTLVAGALLEFRDQGATSWNPRHFAGYVRRLREREAINAASKPKADEPGTVVIRDSQGRVIDPKTGLPEGVEPDSGEIVQPDQVRDLMRTLSIKDPP